MWVKQSNGDEDINIAIDISFYPNIPDIYCMVYNYNVWGGETSSHNQHPVPECSKNLYLLRICFMDHKYYYTLYLLVDFYNSMITTGYDNK